MSAPNSVCKVCEKPLPKTTCGECGCKTRTSGYFCASCGYLVHEKCFTNVNGRVICNNCHSKGNTTPNDIYEYERDYGPERGR